MQALRYFGLLLFSWSFLLSAHAAVDSSLYQAEVPVASYSPDDWQKAVAPGLQQVLVKLTGNSKVGQVPEVRKAIAKASALVQSFTYANHATSNGKNALVLQLRFSPKSINKLLQDAGQPNLATGDTPIAPDTATTAAQATTQAAPIAPPAQGAASYTINMVVSRVSGLNDYTALLDYVRHLEGVTDVNSKQTRGDQVLLVVKTNIPLSELAQVIARDKKLAQEQPAGSVDPGVLLLQYRWVGGDANKAAPIAEGAPSSSRSDSAIPDSNQAQSFGVPSSDNGFAPERGVSP